MNLYWYINRLSKMSFPEICWRVVEKLNKEIDKKKIFAPIDNCHSIDKKIFLLSENFKSEIMEKYFSKNLEQHLFVANNVLNNKFYSFNIAVNFKQDINWNLDPITKKTWPKKFWADISYTDKSFASVKFVWEINRFYFIVSLGIVYKFTKDKKYANKIIQIINSWLEQNPYPIGVNWTSSIESGIRLTNFIWGLSFLKDYTFSKQDLKSINSFVFFHARHIDKYPSKYSSSNNHLIAEGFGLFISGVYFPYLKNSKHWFIKGKDILEKQVLRQIFPDGGSFEYSTTYLSFVLDFFLLFKKICETHNIVFEKSLNKVLEKSCEFILALMDKKGFLANIGDQDSAIVVNFGLSNWENFKAILNTAAFIFKRPGFIKDTYPDIKTFLLYNDSFNYFKDNQPIEDKKNKIFFFKDSGISIIKDKIDSKQILFTGNASKLGMPPLYAHGHLDALSLFGSV